jgi:hypothetical protein
MVVASQHVLATELHDASSGICEKMYILKPAQIRKIWGFYKETAKVKLKGKRKKERIETATVLLTVHFLFLFFFYNT